MEQERAAWVGGGAQPGNLKIYRRTTMVGSFCEYRYVRTIGTYEVHYASECRLYVELHTLRFLSSL